MYPIFTTLPEGKLGTEEVLRGKKFSKRQYQTLSKTLQQEQYLPMRKHTEVFLTTLIFQMLLKEELWEVILEVKTIYIYILYNNI